MSEYTVVEVSVDNPEKHLPGQPKFIIHYAVADESGRIVAGPYASRYKAEEMCEDLNRPTKSCSSGMSM
ncbi:hypothetical protein [Cellvibrio sp. NN19]|jgi:hypothetical protein|uniref:hypothetical protein n=1 Tax=Cellvibrio chitinivorans TaxID=3102792 RepID=UPI002B416735|nr:hypothetical protein [Cellvibrio sp. NN19]